VTIEVHGPLPELERLLEDDGWTLADKPSLGADLRYFGAAVHQELDDGLAATGRCVDGFEAKLHLPFPRLGTVAPEIAGVQRMPLSAQTLDGVRSVAEFQKNNQPLGGRDHFRVYATGEQDSAGEPIELIAASRDTDVYFASHHPETFFLYHHVDPNVDPERDMVVQSLVRHGARATSFVQNYDAIAGNKLEVPDSRGYDVTLPSALTT
jgi:hypothetical protein